MRGSEDWRTRIEKLVLADLDARRIAYVHGTVGERAAQVRRVLEAS